MLESLFNKAAGMKVFFTHIFIRNSILGLMLGLLYNLRFQGKTCLGVASQFPKFYFQEICLNSKIDCFLGRINNFSIVTSI